MQRSPNTVLVNASRVSPGDLLCGRIVHSVAVDGDDVRITYDDGHVTHADARDLLEADMAACASWVRLEPLTHDVTGERCGWTLVLQVDADWQDWSLAVKGHRQEFRVAIDDRDVETLAMATVVPTTVMMMSEAEE